VVLELRAGMFHFDGSSGEGYGHCGSRMVLSPEAV